MRTLGAYSEDEVRALIEHYEHLRELTDTKARGLEWLARRNDLDDALALIPEEYWEVVLIAGMIGFTTYETARLLQISRATVSKRYRYAIEEITYYINGGE